jgi:hypothetical protein
MTTALMSVRNVLDGRRDDVWAVNSEVEYAEDGGGGTARAVPRPLVPSD